MGIEQTIALNLRRLCEAKNMSLSELARRSGVGKATLSNLAATGGNPTVQTLSSLAEALGCALGDLIETSDPEVLRHDEGIWIEGTATRGRLIARLYGQRGVDVHEVLFKAGMTHEDLLLPGTVEHLFVLSGHLTVEVDERTVDLAKGDTITLARNQGYKIRATEGDARGLFFINA